VRDEVAKSLRKVFADVEIEPVLQNVPEDVQRYLKQGYRSAIVDDEARSDIRVKGFWIKERNAFLDIRVFNPNASSNRNQHSIDATYRRHEQEKKRQYNARILEVEHGSFTPLVFASTGGISKETTVFLKKSRIGCCNKRRRRLRTYNGTPAGPTRFQVDAGSHHHAAGLTLPSSQH
jgi:hypothetical protein